MFRVARQSKTSSGLLAGRCTDLASGAKVRSRSRLAQKLARYTWTVRLTALLPLVAAAAALAAFGAAAAAAEAVSRRRFVPHAPPAELFSTSELVLDRCELPT